MKFSVDEKKYFFENGFIVKQNVVNSESILKSKLLVNANLGESGIANTDFSKMNGHSYCDGIQKDPRILGLFNDSPMYELSESLMGVGRTIKANWAQIALRFPAHPEKKATSLAMHIDGLGTDFNGIPAGEFRKSFALLGMVLLQDLPEQDSGNFVLWPKSHFSVQNYIAGNGIEVLNTGVPNVELPEPPYQFVGKAGDVIFCHYLTMHAAARNISPEVRYAVFFRIKNIVTPKTLTEDMWGEFLV